MHGGEGGYSPLNWGYLHKMVVTKDFLESS